MQNPLAEELRRIFAVGGDWPPVPDWVTGARFTADTAFEWGPDGKRTEKYIGNRVILFVGLNHQHELWGRYADGWRQDSYGPGKIDAGI